MNAPDSNRVTITDLPNGAEIVILPFQQLIIWMQAVVYLVFFGGFTYFIFFDKTTNGRPGNPAYYPVIGMYIVIVWALISVGYAIWWTIKGKEVVTIANGVLTIDKVNAIEKTKRYDMRLAVNFRAEEEAVQRGRNFGRIEGYAWQKAVKGTVKFDYDVTDVIQFGDWLSEAEGEYILQKLRDKKLIT